MKTLKTATLIISLLALSTASAFAIEYSGIGGIPAYPKEDNPRSESIFIYENAPGSVVEDGVVVINNTQDKKTILVYATDTTPHQVEALHVSNWQRRSQMRVSGLS